MGIDDYLRRKSETKAYEGQERSDDHSHGPWSVGGWLELGTPMTTYLPGWPLALFRIAFGLLYLDMAWQKAPWVVQEGHRFGWLYGYIQKEIAHATFGWYQAFLANVVLPHFTVFGTLTFLTELVLGVSLLLGLFTRLGGLAGFLWQINIALGSYSIPGDWFWIWPLLTLPQFCFAMSGAGRIWGLDAYLEPALRRHGEAAPWARLLRYVT